MARWKRKQKTDLYCSFCGKRQAHVQKLIPGPGVYICDECVVICNQILDEEGIPTRTAQS